MDLTEGSYDLHLERLRADSSAHDPPPLTPERLTAILAGLSSQDPDEQRWSQLELAGHPDDEPWNDDAFTDELRHLLESADPSVSAPAGVARPRPLASTW
ncbi:MAG TPA: hypothetical protein VFN34_06460 [Ornithinibacter sp.]|nr:hypothetical protein [Ornithinibacter sp.]